MSKIRLNSEMRKELLTYAKTLISFPEEEAALEAAYQKADALVRDAIDMHCTPAEMSVLLKFDMVHRRNYISLTNIDTNITRHFQFRGKEEDWPWWLWSRNVRAPQVVLDAVEDHTFQEEQLKEKRQQLENDYHNLIRSAYHFEELEQVWPEITVMRASLESRVNHKAVSNLSAEALARIKADMAKRQQDG